MTKSGVFVNRYRLSIEFNADDDTTALVEYEMVRDKWITDHRKIPVESTTTLEKWGIGTWGCMTDAAGDAL